MAPTVPGPAAVRPKETPRDISNSQCQQQHFLHTEKTAIESSDMTTNKMKS